MSSFETILAEKGGPLNPFIFGGDELSVELDSELFNPLDYYFFLSFYEFFKMVKLQRSWDLQKNVIKASYFLYKSVKISEGLFC